MALLEIGTQAPDFKLTAADGKSYSLKEKLSTDLTLLAIFKINCPTCQFTFPFLEKLHKNYAGKGFTLWGISQNNQAETMQFASQYKVSFPLLLDQNNYQISYAYRITVVPTLFLIDKNQEILFA
ncbi:MAG TPA: TlpA disulfide reductase family protein, partial [candidate division Zixibacteria bacterium]|nr:TlpA disulfide reductase family protein [candidate division Zixibacteria bacterium]